MVDIDVTRENTFVSCFCFRWRARSVPPLRRPDALAIFQHSILRTPGTVGAPHIGMLEERRAIYGGQSQTC